MRKQSNLLEFQKMNEIEKKNLENLYLDINNEILEKVGSVNDPRTEQVIKKIMDDFQQRINHQTLNEFLLNCNSESLYTTIINPLTEMSKKKLALLFQREVLKIHKNNKERFILKKQASKLEEQFKSLQWEKETMAIIQTHRLTRKAPSSHSSMKNQLENFTDELKQLKEKQLFLEEELSNEKIALKQVCNQMTNLGQRVNIQFEETINKENELSSHRISCIKKIEQLQKEIDQDIDRISKEPQRLEKGIKELYAQFSEKRNKIMEDFKNTMENILSNQLSKLKEKSDLNTKNISERIIKFDTSIQEIKNDSDSRFENEHNQFNEKNQNLFAEFKAEYENGQKIFQKSQKNEVNTFETKFKKITNEIQDEINQMSKKNEELVKKNREDFDQKKFLCLNEFNKELNKNTENFLNDLTKLKMKGNEHINKEIEHYKHRVGEIKPKESYNGGDREQQLINRFNQEVILNREGFIEKFNNSQNKYSEKINLQHTAFEDIFNKIIAEYNHSIQNCNIKNQKISEESSQRYDVFLEADIKKFEEKHEKMIKKSNKHLEKETVVFQEEERERLQKNQKLIQSQNSEFEKAFDQNIRMFTEKVQASLTQFYNHYEAIGKVNDEKKERRANRLKENIEILLENRKKRINTYSINLGELFNEKKQEAICKTEEIHRSFIDQCKQQIIDFENHYALFNQEREKFYQKQAKCLNSHLSISVDFY